MTDKPLYTVLWPRDKTCVAWMPWNWHHNRRPQGRRTRP